DDLPERPAGGAGLQAVGEGEHVPRATRGADQRDELLGRRVHERGREGGDRGVQGEADAEMEGEIADPETSSRVGGVGWGGWGDGGRGGRGGRSGGGNGGGSVGGGHVGRARVGELGGVLAGGGRALYPRARLSALERVGGRVAGAEMTFMKLRWARSFAFLLA